MKFFVVFIAQSNAIAHSAPVRSITQEIKQMMNFKGFGRTANNTLLVPGLDFVSPSNLTRQFTFLEQLAFLLLSQIVTVHRVIFTHIANAYLLNTFKVIATTRKDSVISEGTFDRLSIDSSLVATVTGRDKHSAITSAINGGGLTKSIDGKASNLLTNQIAICANALSAWLAVTMSISVKAANRALTLIQTFGANYHNLFVGLWGQKRQVNCFIFKPYGAVLAFNFSHNGIIARMIQSSKHGGCDCTVTAG